MTEVQTCALPIYAVDVGHALEDVGSKAQVPEGRLDLLHLADPAPGLGRHPGDPALHALDHRRLAAGELGHQLTGQAQFLGRDQQLRLQGGGAQIGRASCRESESISVDAL